MTASKLNTGHFCISIDVERAWGIWDRPSETYFDRCRRLETTIVDELGAMFDRYEVTATWAVVSGLLVRDSERPDTALWYGRDTVDAIRSLRTPQDVGSHSYAHVYYDQIAPAEAREDLAAAKAIHERHGLDFASFVFPRNGVAHLDALAESSVRVYRSTDRGLHMAIRARFGRVAGRLANLAEKAIPLRPVVVEPIKHANGLIELPSSMLFMSREGLRRVVRPQVTLAKCRRALAAAAQQHKVFHLWFHPSNFYASTYAQLSTLEDIVREAASWRDRGLLEISPMSAFAHHEIYRN